MITQWAQQKGGYHIQAASLLCVSEKAIKVRDRPYGKVNRDKGVNTAVWSTENKKTDLGGVDKRKKTPRRRGK